MSSVLGTKGCLVDLWSSWGLLLFFLLLLALFTDCI